MIGGEYMKIKLKDADRLNELIIMKGFNKTEFSKEIKLSQPMTIQITNGDRNPSPRTAKTICVILDVQFDELFSVVRAEKQSLSIDNAIR
jgi:DNA-binding XRE family transcriptional regulator